MRVLSGYSTCSRVGLHGELGVSLVQGFLICRTRRQLLYVFSFNKTLKAQIRMRCDVCFGPTTRDFSGQVFAKRVPTFQGRMGILRSHHYLLKPYSQARVRNRRQNHLSEIDSIFFPILQERSGDVAGEEHLCGLHRSSGVMA